MSHKGVPASPPSRPAEFYLRPIVWAAISGHYLTWLRFLPDSYWLDECGTIWLVSGGYSDLLRRTLLLLHAPLFGLIATTIAAIAGASEVAMRLPSWIAVGIGLFCFWRLARKLLGPDTGLVAMSIMTVWPIVCYIAADARPYAYELVAISLAYYWFIESLETLRRKSLGLFAVAIACVVHLQLLYLYILAIPALYLLLMDRESLRRHWRKWLATYLAIIGMLVPLIWHYRVMFNWGSKYSFSPVPSMTALFAVLTPARPLVFFLVPAILCAPFVKRINWRLSRQDTQVVSFALIAALFPVLLLFVVSNVTEARLFVPRYMLPAVPGIALFWAWVAGRIEPVSVRYVLAISTLVVILILQWLIGNWHHERDDWRGALARAEQLMKDRQTPLFVYTGYVESGRLQSVRPAADRGFLLAPVVAYPVAAADVIAIPLEPNIDAKRLIDREIAGQKGRIAEFVVVLRAEMFYAGWLEYLNEIALREGYRLEHRDTYGEPPPMQVLHFRRY